MCTSSAILYLSLAISLVQGLFLLKEKKELIICKKICPLYCKDIYKQSQRRSDDGPLQFDEDYPPYPPSFKEWPGEIEIEDEDFYPGNFFSHYHFTPETTTPTTTTTTTEEPTFICMLCIKKCPPPKS